MCVGDRTIRASELDFTSGRRRTDRQGESHQLRSFQKDTVLCCTLDLARPTNGESQMSPTCRSDAVHRG